MRTKLLGAFCLLFPLLSVAADIQRITPITSDKAQDVIITILEVTTSILKGIKKLRGIFVKAKK